MPESEKEILNMDEACLLLGVSIKTFHKVLREGEIPGRKIGREWKFSRQALIDWVGSAQARDFLDVGKKRGPKPKNKEKRVVQTREIVGDRFSVEED
jgi:excisionase family DNA binding protein